mmetsp:Transcript_16232/g.43734  ORF Transcript_16232/g.43734 Transcript_16232/m.43734 type:complete len:260 (-) Transcript_16232:22-801(-)
MHPGALIHSSTLLWVGPARRRLVACEDVHDGALDRVGLLGSVHFCVEALLGIVVNDRGSLCVEGTEALAECGLVVIRALDERLACLVVAEGHERLGKLFVVTPAAGRVHHAPGDALDEELVVDLHLNNVVERHLFLCEHVVQLLGLLHGAREAVEDEAVLALLLGDGILDDAHHDLVGHKASRLHHLVRGLAHLRASGHGSAEHVAGGQVAQAEALLDYGRLRALARSWRAHKDHALLIRLVEPFLEFREELRRGDRFQ